MEVYINVLLMANLLFSRLHSIEGPVESLTEEQRTALNKFREKLGRGVYSFEQANCLCGRQKGKLIAQRDRYALPVNTYVCKSCGVMWTNPRMTRNSLMKFYQEDYRPIYVGHMKAPDDFFTAQAKHGQAIYNFLESRIPLAQGLKVFDVGCGAGGMLIPFLNAGWSVFGCDLGTEYLKCGQTAGLVLEHGDASALEKYGPANLVILSHVLEHFQAPWESLNQISRLLVDDGYLYVELPGIFRIHKTYGDILLFLQNAHLYHFTLTTLNCLTAQAGFGILKGDESIRALYRKDNT